MFALQGVGEINKIASQKWEASKGRLFMNKEKKITSHANQKYKKAQKKYYLMWKSLTKDQRERRVQTLYD